MNRHGRLTVGMVRRPVCGQFGNDRQAKSGAPCARRHIRFDDPIALLFSQIWIQPVESYRNIL